MSDTLLIGPVLLRDFELPERIRWGGAQRLAVHRLPGGRRVLDAMGRDDADIAWSGTFSGPDATTRARTLDLMRAEGGPWPLLWGSFLYTVVVARFDAAYARENWIPYRISCTVLRDEVGGLAEAGLSIAGAVLGDLGTAATLGALDLAPTQSLLAEPGALTAGTAAHAAALDGLRVATAATRSAIATAGASLLGADLATPDGPRQASRHAETLARASQTHAPLSRARANLEALRE